MNATFNVLALLNSGIGFKLSQAWAASLAVFVAKWAEAASCK
jgi:hypothetical protein